MTKKFILVLTVIISITQLSACASIASGKTFLEFKEQLVKKNDNPKVIVFRPDRLTGSGDTMLIFANAKDQGELLPLGFLAFEIPMEKVVLHTDTAGIDRQYELEAEAGQTYYFKTTFTNYVLTGAWDLIPTTEAIAITKMKELRESIKPNSILNSA